MLGKGLELKSNNIIIYNNKIVNQLKKCGLFSDFHYGFKSSRSIADLLTVVSDRIGSAFNKFCTTRALTLVISKACGRVWLKSFGISYQILGLFSRKNHLLRCWSWPSSKMDWGSYIISVAKTSSKKIGALTRFMNIFFPDVSVYLCKSTIRPCMEYCFLGWAAASSC